MLKASTVPNVAGKDKIGTSKTRLHTAAVKKRAHSLGVPPSVKSPRPTSPAAFGRRITERRCHSLSPAVSPAAFDRRITERRCHSLSLAVSPAAVDKRITERRCHSLSPAVNKKREPSYPDYSDGYYPSAGGLVPGRTVDGQSSRVQSKRSIESEQPTTVTCDDMNYTDLNNDGQSIRSNGSEKEPAIPHCLMTKLMRALATKKREFLKLRKSLIVAQNNVLEHYAAVKDLETRAGITGDGTTGEVRILSVSGWPAHDLLLLVRKDIDMPLNSEISGIFGGQILQQLHAQLNPIPEEVLDVGAEIMARRIDLLNLLRGKHRADRATYLTNLEWRTKNNEFDEETERLHRLVVGLVENLKAKLNYSLNLAKISWLDRDALIKKVEKFQKDNMILQHKVDEISHKKENEEAKDIPMDIESTPAYQAICEELNKEKSAREALKEVVSSAESMLRVARARIATLERQYKDTKAELDISKRKQKDLEQLVNQLAHAQHSQATYRHRETSYDVRSRKLLEVSKTGEITIEALSRQRDALELRVKELREQIETSEKLYANKEAEQKARIESLQAKVAEQMANQEKLRRTSEDRIAELENKAKEVEEQYKALKERSVRLVDTERRRCLEYVPSKETEPSDRETEIWKELQVTRVALSRAEEELRQSRADKDSFLNSLNRIAQGEDADSFKDKMVMELLDREQKIVKLQHVIDEQRDNEKLMEQSMTQYENQLAALRVEVKRLRNYDCYTKDIPYQELQTELLELHMQVETLSRERTALVTAAASRALMLERHERSAELFARMTRARRDLAALIDGRTEPPQMDEVVHAEVSRSLSSVCTNAAETWTALRAERARVLRLESAVLAQSLQLEREGRVRTQLERRRALLERELLRVQHSAPFMEKNANLGEKLK